MPTEKRFQCRHIFTDGHRCGSPTLLLETPTGNETHEDFCYYHHTTRRPQPRARGIHEDPTQTAFALPIPEDRSSIQAAIGQVLAHIAANTLDPRRAGLLLYGLQIAALNLPPHPRPHPLHERDEVPEPVTAIVTHPTHGPIAPTAELPPPPVYKSLGQRLMEEFGPPPPPPGPYPDPLWHPSVYTPAQRQKQEVQQTAQQQEPTPTILPNLQATAHRVPHVSPRRHGFPSVRAQCLRKRKGHHPHPQPMAGAPIHRVFVSRDEWASREAKLFFLRGANSLRPHSSWPLL
jgi:hypothetical protein